MMMSASPITHTIVQHLAGGGLVPALKYNVRPKRAAHRFKNRGRPRVYFRVPAPYPWHNVPLMFSRWSEPGLEQIRQEAGLVGHGHASGLQRLYLALRRA